MKITIRPAHVSDAKAICSLVNYYAERGRMLHRSLESAYLGLRDFLVAVDESGAVVGCVAVGIFWSDLAEVKSLAVAGSQQGKGIGAKLVKAAIASARKLGIKKLFALTLEKDFFQRHNFDTIDRECLPEKVWRECIYCPKVDACDEIAMMLSLTGPAKATRSARPAGKHAPRKA
jgi:amino-acid N-acetyltransferase